MGTDQGYAWAAGGWERKNAGLFAAVAGGRSPHFWLGRGDVLLQPISSYEAGMAAEAVCRPALQLAFGKLLLNRHTNGEQGGLHGGLTLCHAA